MRRFLVVVVVVIVWCPPVVLQAQVAPDSLLQRLAATEGRARMAVLATLTDATYRNAPDEANAYAREALVLLTTYPDAAIEQQVLFRKGQAHDYLGQWDSVLVVAEHLGTAKATGDAGFLSGLVRLRRGAYDEAIASLKAALAAYEAEDNRARVALALAHLGMAHRRRGDNDEALLLFTRVQGLYEDLGDQQGLATSLHNIGIIRRQLGDYDEALAFLTRALAIREEMGDRRGLAESFNSIGIIRRRLGDYDAALDFYNRALTLREELGDQRGQAIALNNIGLISDERGDDAEALSSYTRALAIREELGDQSGIASSLARVANVYKHQGNYDEALDFLTRVLAIREELGNRLNIASTLHNIANIHYARGEVDEAVVFYERSLAIKEEIGSRTGTAVTLHSLGTVYRERGDYDEALDFYKRALATYENLGDPEGQAIVLSTLGALYAEQGQPTDALTATDRALALADSIGALPLVHDAYSQRADLLEAQGQYQEALAAYRASEAVKDSLFNTESQGVIAELQAQYRTKEQHQQIELLESRRAQQRLWLTVLLGGLGLLVVIIALMVGRMRLRRRALATIEGAHQAIEEKAEELRQKTVELEQANALKSRFLANISHEFRTPLTLTFGPLDDAIKGRFASLAEAQPHFERARRNGGRLLRLINQLLDLSKLDAGALLRHTRVHDMAGHLRQLASLFDSIAENRQIAFTTQIPDERLLHVYDADKIEKVVINLLSNAFKFTQSGGKVSFLLTKEADRTARIEVADTGRGIAEEHLPHLFDRFYQVESGTTRSQEGTGIGLALVKELVELHEGTITVESTIGFGTRFTVRLPQLNTDVGETDEMKPDTLSEADIAPGDGAVEALDGSLAAPASQHEHPSAFHEDETETVVLVVEDNADMRAYIRSHLDDIVTVVEAENGQAGVAQAVEVVPDLILSDVMMPEMDGLELCQAVKADERTSHIPVVLLTARAQVEHRIAGFEVGADAYLPKPFNADELRVRVQTLIQERRRLRRQFAGLAPERIQKEHPGREVPPALPPREAAFLAKVEDLITANLSDSQYGIERLAEDLAMSRRQLFRKLQALIEETPGALMRRVRLAHAAVLLGSGEHTIKEVAYAVGFQSANSFTRAFRETYGVPPSEYITSTS